ncbi:hypothetical protein BC830DRAFT_688505 [Chytriomyces sp. MP71]|nr:hypothetical protein BC830DRAFT_688505 [Chytriomyces sp. MP71]
MRRRRRLGCSCPFCTTLPPSASLTPSHSPTGSNLQTNTSQTSADALVCVRDVIRSVGERGSVSKDAARQAQMIVWKCGEAAMEGHRWQDAVDWIGVALKLAVGGVADEQNMAALLKKLALCHVQLRQFDEATEACRRAAICQQDAQSSLQLTYLLFLIHLEQGHAELASKQMENMAAQLQEAADPTKSLQFLLTTMDRSFKAGNQKVLKKILGILLKQFGSQDNHAWRCIIVMALRCLIRLVIAADTNQLDASVYGEVQKYIAAALTPLEALKRENAPSLNLEPELTWFSQTCWNLAVKTCAEFPAIACQFFSLSAKIASLSVAGEGGGLVSLPALKNQKISLFIAFLGEIELARDAGQSGTDHIQRARTLLTGKTLKVLQASS